MGGPDNLWDDERECNDGVPRLAKRIQQELLCQVAVPKQEVENWLLLRICAGKES